MSFFAANFYWLFSDDHVFYIPGVNQFCDSFRFYTLHKEEDQQWLFTRCYMDCHTKQELPDTVNSISSAKEAITCDTPVVSGIPELHGLYALKQLFIGIISH
ncbi:hypothetical protein J6590_008436 [Homalodisca vitripennis]|nr:hypothetical protein J6590_008436 [Homalodisca vitripennis]